MPHPNPDNKPSLHARLRKTKAALLATALTLAGVLLIMLNGWLSSLNLGDWSWLHALPLGELGGTLFGAGLLSVRCLNIPSAKTKKLPPPASFARSFTMRRRRCGMR